MNLSARAHDGDDGNDAALMGFDNSLKFRAWSNPKQVYESQVMVTSVLGKSDDGDDEDVVQCDCAAH